MTCVLLLSPGLTPGQDDKQAKENAELRALVKKLQHQLEETQIEHVKTKDQLEAAQFQVKALRERLMQLEAFLAKKGGGVPLKGAAPKINPPPANVKGTIEKIDPKNPTLVEISIGSDAGLEVGHTLEVFRLKPAPRYLGVVRIVAVMPQRAIGQHAAPTGAAAVLRTGDQVTSGLGARKEP